MPQQRPQIPLLGGRQPDLRKPFLHQQPPAPSRLRPTVPARLDDAILKAIEKDRNLRYQHASDIRADLLRSKLWDPQSWRPDALPSHAALVKRVQETPETLEELEQHYAVANYSRLLY